MLYTTIHSLFCIGAFLAAGAALRGVGLLDKADAQVHSHMSVQLCSLCAKKLTILKLAINNVS